MSFIIGKWVVKVGFFDLGTNEFLNIGLGLDGSFWV